MRKLLTFVLLLSTFALFAQKGILVQEDFSSATVPPDGWTIDAHSDNWSAKYTNNAGGEAPEARFSWSPEFNGESRMISPVIDASGATTLRIAFKHSVDHYGGAYTLGVATTSDGGSTWNDAWTGGGSNVTESHDIEITTPDVGSENFQFCVYFSGNSYNLNYWYVDDIMLYNPADVDLMAAGLDVPTYMGEGGFSVNLTVANFGVDEIMSFQAHYQLNDYTVVDQTFSGLSLTTGNTTEVTFDDMVGVVSGDHVLNVWISNVNGGPDDDQSNDTITHELHVATQVVDNFPIFEEFTSSTCGPCASFNSSVFTPFLSSHEGELAVIKYQMNWPGSGDPYYTAEGGVRRNFYGVSGVPDLFGGGGDVATSSSGVNNSFSEQNGKDAYMSLSASHYVDVENEKISVQVDLTPYFSGDGFVLHTVVNEKETTGNVGSNGETEFHHVMMKMLPNAEGTPLEFSADETYDYDFHSVDLSATNIEEMTDLEVVVFVQHVASKEIFQASVSVEDTLPRTNATFVVAEEGADAIEGAVIDIENTMITTNSQGEAMISLYTDSTYNYNITADGYMEMDGAVTLTDTDTTINAMMMPIALEHTVTFSVRDLDYDLPIAGAEINIHDTTIVADTTGLALINLMDSTYNYSVSATGYEETTGSVTVSGADTTVNIFMSAVGIDKVSDNINLYPVPAKDQVMIEGINGEVLIYNSAGMIVKSVNAETSGTLIKLNELSPGTYFVKAVNSRLSVTEKLIIIQ